MLVEKTRSILSNRIVQICIIGVIIRIIVGLLFTLVYDASHWVRVSANIASEFVDTTVFITLAFYALNLSFANNFSFLFGIILPYWLLKCFMSVIETPFVYVGTSWLRANEN